MKTQVQTRRVTLNSDLAGQDAIASGFVNGHVSLPGDELHTSHPSRMTPDWSR